MKIWLAMDENYSIIDHDVDLGKLCGRNRLQRVIYMQGVKKEAPSTSVGAKVV